MSFAAHVEPLTGATSKGSISRSRALNPRCKLELVSDSERELGLSWLLKLRWGAVSGQLVVLGLVRLILALDLPYMPLLGLVAFTATTNAALTLLGEPFVTTKAERGGLGLGVYLARAYAERTGGALLFHEREGGGSDVELCLPRDALRGDRRGT